MQRKKERKRARDMDRDHTFDLPDLTEDFWKTVVFAQEDSPSGMGGPGCVCLLSKEGKEYIFGFEETPFYKSTELFPIFETNDERIGYRHKYKAEEHGWKYLEKEEALIREDILDEYSKAAAEAKREKENSWHFYAIDLAGRAIGVEHLERYDYIGSVLYRERMDREMAERRKKCEKEKLTENEFNWKPMHMNNIPDNPEMGVYALLMRRDDGKIKGVKYSILYQYEEHSPMLIYSDAKVEAYILFYADYDDIIGPWDYHSVSRQECAALYGKENHFPPELAYYDWITFSDGDIHNFGRFLRTFQSLEEAKAYAMYYANVNSGGINKETILKQEEESRIEDHVNRIAHYEAYQMYRKYYKKILDAISEENCFPDSCSGGGVYLREAILKKVPEITEEQLRMIWRELPFVIEKRTQDWIEREKQFSENYIRKAKKRKPGKTKRTADQIGK